MKWYIMDQLMDGGIKESNKENVEVTLESAENIDSKERSAFLDQVIAVEKSAWPEELQASREKFAARLEVFPQGFIVAKVNGVVKGVSTSQTTTYNPDVFKTWDELTDNGFIKRSHEASAPDIYVVSIGVAADTQGLGLGSKLVEAQKELAKRLDKKTLFLGARIPGYDAYCKQKGDIPIEEYLELKNERNEPIDPEIRFYSRRNLKVSKIIKSFEPDAASRDYGAVMTWNTSHAS